MEIRKAFSSRFARLLVCKVFSPITNESPSLQPYAARHVFRAARGALRVAHRVFGFAPCRFPRYTRDPWSTVNQVTMRETCRDEAWHVPSGCTHMTHANLHAMPMLSRSNFSMLRIYIRVVVASTPERQQTTKTKKSGCLYEDILDAQ